jgi:hypothetical protein
MVSLPNVSLMGAQTMWGLANAEDALSFYALGSRGQEAIWTGEPSACSVRSFNTADAPPPNGSASYGIANQLPDVFCLVVRCRWAGAGNSWLAARCREVSSV